LSERSDIFIEARLARSVSQEAHNRSGNWIWTWEKIYVIGIRQIAPSKNLYERCAMNSRHLYTVEQAAIELSISRATLYRLIIDKQIVSIKIGKCRRVSQQAIEAFIEQKTKNEYASW
jgi:excisionase family DNA binding protein